MGFVFRRDGIVYRQVNAAFADAWLAFDGSDLQRDLISSGSLIRHEDADLSLGDAEAIAVIQPEPVPFISQPSEWTFGQLKDAALLTLEIEARSLDAGFTLRDASPFNVQFVGNRPVFIDSLSFEPYPSGSPWRAYRQFCEQFLGPLALISRRHVGLRALIAGTVDGVPLDLASRILPWQTRLDLGLGTHIHLHARAHGKLGDARDSDERRTRSVRLDALVESLRRTVEGLRWEPRGTQWADYDERGSYSAQGLGSKDAIIQAFLSGLDASRIWDLGANTGRYSIAAEGLGHDVLALDADPAATERLYQATRGATPRRVLPLVVDLANPTAAIGWAHEERPSLTDRADADVLMAFALVHHLRIGSNVPFDRMSSWFARLGSALIIEFVPPDDPMAARLLSARADITDYAEESFLKAFRRDWKVDRQIAITDSGRSIFVMSRRSEPRPARVT